MPSKHPPTWYIGIDPGKSSGGIVSLDTSGAIRDLLPMHTVTESDLRALAAWCFSSERRCKVYIEEPGFSPVWSKIAIRELAMHFGMLKGIFHSAVLISPRDWQKIAWVQGSWAEGEKDPKAKSLSSAKVYWPKESFTLIPKRKSKKPPPIHTGLVDAALIARSAYAMDTLMHGYVRSD